MKDGLSDAYDNAPMGNCAENCARTQNISRKEQDDFAILSYQRAAESTKNGLFAPEIVPVEVPQRKGSLQNLHLYSFIILLFHHASQAIL